MSKAMFRGQFSRRAVLAGLAVAPFVRGAHAEAAWPTRPVQVMVPYPPAGGADTTGRILFGKVYTASFQYAQSFDKTRDVVRISDIGRDNPDFAAVLFA